MTLIIAIVTCFSKTKLTKLIFFPKSLFLSRVSWLRKIGCRKIEVLFVQASYQTLFSLYKIWSAIFSTYHLQYYYVVLFYSIHFQYFTLSVYRPPAQLITKCNNNNNGNTWTICSYQSRRANSRYLSSAASTSHIQLQFSVRPVQNVA